MNTQREMGSVSFSNKLIMIEIVSTETISRGTVLFILKRGGWGVKCLYNKV